MRVAPQSTPQSHSPDQCPHFGMDWRATSWIPRLPVATKSGTMPAHQRLGPDDCDGIEDRPNHRYIRMKNRRSLFVNSTRPRGSCVATQSADVGYRYRRVPAMPHSPAMAFAKSSWVPGGWSMVSRPPRIVLRSSVQIWLIARGWSSRRLVLAFRRGNSST